MLNVREFKHRGIFGDVHVGAVRCQGLGDRTHGVGVLGKVLVAGEQSLGEAVVNLYLKIEKEGLRVKCK